MPRQKHAFTQRDIDARQKIGLGPRAAIPIRKEAPAGTKSADAAEADIRGAAIMAAGDPTEAEIRSAQKLAGKAKVRDQEFVSKLIFALKLHQLRTLTDQQERPTKVIAALQRGLAPARALLEFLDALPQSLRSRLGEGGTERRLFELSTNISELITNTQNEIAYQSKHVVQHRPSAAGLLWRDLRDELYELYSAYHPDEKDPHEDATPRQRQQWRGRRDRLHQRRRYWAADVMRSIDVKFPDEKKNPDRFEAGRGAPR
jgi:hypothetical protein